MEGDITMLGKTHVSIGLATATFATPSTDVVGNIGNVMLAPIVRIFDLSGRLLSFIGRG